MGREGAPWFGLGAGGACLRPEVVERAAGQHEEALRPDHLAQAGDGAGLQLADGLARDSQRGLEREGACSYDASSQVLEQ